MPILFPASPLEFRTARFPQYGFKHSVSTITIHLPVTSLYTHALASGGFPFEYGLSAVGLSPVPLSENRTFPSTSCSRCVHRFFPLSTCYHGCHGYCNLIRISGSECGVGITHSATYLSLLGSGWNPDTPCFAHKTLQPCYFPYTEVPFRCTYPSCLNVLTSPSHKRLVTLTTPLEPYSRGLHHGAAELT